MDERMNLSELLLAQLLFSLNGASLRFSLFLDFIMDSMFHTTSLKGERGVVKEKNNRIVTYLFGSFVSCGDLTVWNESTRKIPPQSKEIYMYKCIYVLQLFISNFAFFLNYTVVISWNFKNNKMHLCNT